MMELMSDARRLTLNNWGFAWLATNEVHGRRTESARSVTSSYDERALTMEVMERRPERGLGEWQKYQTQRGAILSALNCSSRHRATGTRVR